MEYTRTIDIGASPATVWQVMTTLERWPEWTDSVTSVTVLDPGELRPGQRARVGIKGGPKGTWTVTDVSPGQSFAWENRAPGVKSVADHVIEEAPGGSRVTLSVRQSGLGATLLRPFLKKVSLRNLEMEAAGLKRASEAAG
jgi:uncharacterized protein YndB with AHSA1/START domain